MRREREVHKKAVSLSLLITARIWGYYYYAQYPISFFGPLVSVRASPNVVSYPFLTVPSQFPRFFFPRLFLTSGRVLLRTFVLSIWASDECPDKCLINIIEPYFIILIVWKYILLGPSVLYPTNVREIQKLKIIFSKENRKCRTKKRRRRKRYRQFLTRHLSLSLARSLAPRPSSNGNRKQ